MLFGARGTGKTALIHQTFSALKNTVVIDLLRGRAYQRYVSDPSLFGDEMREAVKRKREPLVVAIDEVQRVPALLDEVHSLMEEHKGQIVFLLTGSSARKLKRGEANLLAGRAVTRHLHPLSSLETPLELARALQYGTLPGVYLDADTEISTLESYVGTYLQEEIQQESIVRRVDRFTRFLDFAGQLNGEPINFAKLGAQCGVAGKTVLEYYSILEDTLLASRLNGWSHSIKKQLLQAPRFYLFDCGVLNAINGELRTELKSNGFRYGKLFENLVVQELFRANDYLDLGLKFHYWRDKDGHEVDIIVSRNLTVPLAAIEIKSSPHPTAADCSGFKSFAAEYPKVQRFCFCTTPRSFDRSQIRFMPWQDGVLNIEGLITSGG
ncbi:MAG: ATP-binding protein [Deltaproteobacteria bacterium]|nr:ATP-binding protein [Deltaproteobacteria bacterium]MBI3295693.1 ATP-binding protein [Deltaproteobacteria bacterium]